MKKIIIVGVIFLVAAAIYQYTQNGRSSDVTKETKSIETVANDEQEVMEEMPDEEVSVNTLTVEEAAMAEDASEDDSDEEVIEDEGEIEEGDIEEEDEGADDEEEEVAPSTNLNKDARVKGSLDEEEATENIEQIIDEQEALMQKAIEEEAAEEVETKKEN